MEYADKYGFVSEFKNSHDYDNEYKIYTDFIDGKCKCHLVLIFVFGYGLAGVDDDTLSGRAFRKLSKEFLSDMNKFSTRLISSGYDVVVKHRDYHRADYEFVISR